MRTYCDTHRGKQKSELLLLQIDFFVLSSTSFFVSYEKVQMFKESDSPNNQKQDTLTSLQQISQYNVT